MAFIEFKNLHTWFYTDAGIVKAVNGVDFEIRKGETVCVVGESGCGKSVTSLSPMHLVQSPPGKIVYGEILMDGRDLLKLSKSEMEHVNGKDVAMIFQEPMTSLNPVLKVGHQIMESILFHTDATKEEAREETMRMLGIYENTAKDLLAIPMVTGRKTEREKFAGAEETYTIEALMHDGKALQSGTSHYFGDGFAKAFGIQFLDKDNKQKYVYQTSWGVSTRLLGAIIMVHGDDNGLVLPPRVAPTQVMIIPIQQQKEGILDKAHELEQQLKASGIRVKVDASDKSPGWKFSEAEMRGIPLRLEVGPRDLQNGQCVVAKRVNGEKITLPLDEKLPETIAQLLDDIHEEMYQKALAFRNDHITNATSFEEFKEILNTKGGYVKLPWCGDEACEVKIKEETAATSRCIDTEATVEGVCPICGKKAKHIVYFARAY